jgi:DUF971 family protein
VEPTDLEHDTKRNRLTVGWEDGTVSVLEIPYLRAWCPCAACQGHGTITRYLGEDAELTARAIEEVGAYALRFTFSDGHDTGIYRWSWLWAIASESDPRGPKRGMFEGDEYRHVH